MRTKYCKNTPILDKLLMRATVDLVKESCWEWNAGKDRNGYGRIWYLGKNQTAHVVVYSVFVGEIPNSLHVRHTCDNPACINPSHLVLGTHTDNMRDKSVRKRIHGEKNPYAKYTDEQRELARNWKGSPNELANAIGMSAAYICNLRKENKTKFK